MHNPTHIKAMAVIRMADALHMYLFTPVGKQTVYIINEIENAS